MNSDDSKETELGLIPKDWNLKVFSDIVDIIGGGTPKTTCEDYWGDEIPWLSVVDFNNNFRTVFETEKSITELGLKNSSTKILKKGEIIISARGTVGATAQLGKDMAFNQSCYGLRAKNGYNNDFIYYLLNYQINQLKQTTHGSTFDTITTKTFDLLDVTVPTLQEQKTIAYFLSVMDDKIELNQKMNQTLEQIGQALFRHWFVNFEFPNSKGQPYKYSGGEMEDSELGEIPKGWDVGKLEDIANLVMGLSPKSDSYNHDKIGLPLLNGAADLKEDKIAPTKYTISPTRICKLGDILFCIRATIGNINFADNEYCLGRGVAAISGKKSYQTEFIYFQIYKSLENLVSQATGSVIKGLSKPDIQNIEIIIPPAPLLRKFSSIISKHFEEIQNLKKENENLSEIRDSLLPKLMSGKIRVNIPEEATAK